MCFKLPSYRRGGTALTIAAISAIVIVNFGIVFNYIVSEHYSTISDQSELSEKNNVNVTSNSRERERESMLEWVPIPTDNATSYFTEYELQSMNSSGPKCKADPLLATTCCIGGSSSGAGTKWEPDKCIRNKNLNFYRRYQFTPDDGTPFRMEHVLSLLHRRAVQLNQSRITLYVFGDSVQHQLFDGLICDLYRNGIYPKSRRGRSDKDLTWDDLDSLFPGFYFNRSLSFKDKSMDAYSPIRFKAYYYDYSPAPNGSTDVVEIELKYSMVYRLPDKTAQLWDTICDFGDVFMFSNDLHYNPNDRSRAEHNAGYHNHISQLLSVLKRCMKFKPVIWREMTAQHNIGPSGAWKMYDPNEFKLKRILTNFESDANFSTVNISQLSPSEIETLLQNNGSDYNHLKKHGSYGNRHCFAIQYNNATAEAEYILRWMDTAAKAENIDLLIVYPYLSKEFVSEQMKVSNDTLFVIPFYNVTAPLFDAHGPECTHYCTWPYLWEFVFDSLYRIVDAMWFSTL